MDLYLVVVPGVSRACLMKTMFTANMFSSLSGVQLTEVTINEVAHSNTGMLFNIYLIFY